tara:strand:- start:527 stop:1549 length:1023 start_codon:yes stop_codon:yes gene_type:complete
MKKVIHLGPIDSRGGMATVIKNMISNMPEGYESQVISTHTDDSIGRKIKIWRKARKVLKNKIMNKEADIVHIHATHSISWWRKSNLMKICKNNSIPVVIQIHSGRFQDFCSSFFGITGMLVRKTLSSNCKVVVLEKRWKKILEKWIPVDTTIIPNSSERKIIRENKIGEELIILMLSRKSKGKGHNFAIDILRSLKSKGVSAKLIITGIEEKEIAGDIKENVQASGWVTEIEKESLMAISDFLIMPSDFEGSSMSVIESLVNSLPCLVSPASSETVEINDLIISLDDVEEWSDRIVKLSKPDEYARIIELIEVQSEKYSVQSNKKNIKSLYDEMLLIKQQ